MRDQQETNFAKDVLRANIAMHTALAGTYELEQPHFRPENQALVSRRLADYAQRVGNRVLVDLGCGTGFVIQLAVPLYEQIYGVDITSAMLSRVDTSSRKVKVIKSTTEQIALKGNIADVVTANSFLHHLYDVRPTLAEAYRLLKKGGVFWSEEDPNFDFWQAIKNLKSGGGPVVQREIEAVLKTEEAIEGSKGISADTVKMAEYQKMVLGGMKAHELRQVLCQLGFSTVNIEYYWFLGEGTILHQWSPESVQVIDSYLRTVLPLSSHLFKYLRVEAYK